MWLAMASGLPCHTLDFYTMEREEILSLYNGERSGSDLAIVEGNKGLFDGVSVDGSDSNGAMAKLLDLPVVLVINTNGITRGIAPLLLGYQNFDPEIDFAGVILNQTGGSRHEKKLQQVVEHYTDMPVLGTIPRHPDLEIVERHLGLVPSNEAHEARDKIETIRRVIEEQVDLDHLFELGKESNDGEITHDLPDLQQQEIENLSPSLRVGIARDEAFGFYYSADLDAFHQQGVELVPFSPLHDSDLPDVDGLFIGGGFPETHMAQLENNHSMRKQIYDAIEGGMPTYAECGGLMYLSRQISWGEESHEMVGVVGGDCLMHKRPQGRGYARFQRYGEDYDTPAHEFHYSSLENLDENTDFAYTIQRGFGVDGKHDGIVYKNLLASYLHQRNSRQNPWVKSFVALARDRKNSFNKED